MVFQGGCKSMGNDIRGRRREEETFSGAKDTRLRCRNDILEGGVIGSLVGGYHRRSGTERLGRGMTSMLQSHCETAPGYGLCRCGRQCAIKNAPWSLPSDNITSLPYVTSVCTRMYGTRIMEHASKSIVAQYPKMT